jgi:hypothetical protein
MHTNPYSSLSAAAFVEDKAILSPIHAAYADLRKGRKPTSAAYFRCLRTVLELAACRYRVVSEFGTRHGVAVNVHID